MEASLNLVATLETVWTTRSRRERILMIAAAGLAAACLAVAGAQALTRARAAASDRLAAAAAENAAVTAGLGRLRPSRPGRPRGDARDLETTARRRAQDLGIDITLEAGARDAAFRTESTSAIGLFRWLSLLEADDGIRATALSIERADGNTVAAEGRLAAFERAEP